MFTKILSRSHLHNFLHPKLLSTVSRKHRLPPPTSPYLPLSIAIATVLSTVAISKTTNTSASEDSLLFHYDRLGTVLGEGSFGTVELGRKKSDSSFVAIKTIYEVRDSDEKIALERELSALTAIKNNGGHPNLLALHEIVRGKGPLEIVTELCSGGELFDKVIEDGRIDEQTASKMMKELSDALYFFHEKCKYSHGDIKPENIMLHELTPKLVDFGSSHQKLPNTAQFGTFAYWSPESHLNSPRGSTFLGGTTSDMFALGIIFYIIMLGCHPFDPLGQCTDHELRQNIIHGRYNWQDDDKNEISSAVRNLVDQLLLVNPKDRMTAKELSVRLSKCIQEWDMQKSTLKKKNVTQKEQETRQDQQQQKQKEKQKSSKSVLRRRSVLVRGIIKTVPQDGTQALDSSLTSLLSDQLKRVHYKPGNEIIHQGNANDKKWYLLLKGLVQVELKSNLNVNKNIVAAQLRPGSFFGEGSVLTGSPRAATVRAITPVEVLQLDSHDLVLLNSTDDSIMNDITNKRSMVRYVFKATQ